VHLIAESFEDRTTALDRLSENAIWQAPGSSESVGHPSTNIQASLHRHPHNVRVLPKSRDFH
jgi:hypothetical protein